MKYTISNDGKKRANTYFRLRLTQEELARVKENIKLLEDTTDWRDILENELTDLALVSLEARANNKRFILKELKEYEKLKGKTS